MLKKLGQYAIAGVVIGAASVVVTESVFIVSHGCTKISNIATDKINEKIDQVKVARAAKKEQKEAEAAA